MRHRWLLIVGFAGMIVGALIVAVALGLADPSGWLAVGSRLTGEVGAISPSKAPAASPTSASLPSPSIPTKWVPLSVDLQGLTLLYPAGWTVSPATNVYSVTTVRSWSGYSSQGVPRDYLLVIIRSSGDPMPKTGERVPVGPDGGSGIMVPDESIAQETFRTVHYEAFGNHWVVVGDFGGPVSDGNPMSAVFLRLLTGIQYTHPPVLPSQPPPWTGQDPATAPVIAGITYQRALDALDANGFGCAPARHQQAGIGFHDLLGCGSNTNGVVVVGVMGYSPSRVGFVYILAKGSDRYDDQTNDTAISRVFGGMITGLFDHDPQTNTIPWIRDHIRDDITMWAYETPVRVAYSPDTETYSLEIGWASAAFSR